MAVSIQVVGVNNIVEVINTDTVKTIEVHPTEISPPGPIGPKGDKGDKGDGVPSGGLPVLATNKHPNPRPNTNHNGWNTNNQDQHKIDYDDTVDGGAVRWTVMGVPRPACVSFYGPETNAISRVKISSPGTRQYISLNVINPSMDTAYRMSLYWFDHLGQPVSPSVNGNTYSGPDAGKSGRISDSFVPPENADSYYIVIYVQSRTSAQFPVGSVMWTNKMYIGEVDSAYFDGSMPGARWAANGTSELLFTDSTTALPGPHRAPQGTQIVSGPTTNPMWAPTKTLFLEGEGFPNGVVSAPVGSRYIDLAATNGAVEWIKRTGTGNIGWVVSVGDTGWRDVLSVAGVSSEITSLIIRRTGQEVHVNFSAVRTTTGNTPLVPASIITPGWRFRPSRHDAAWALAHTDATTYHYVVTAAGGNFLYLMSGKAASVGSQLFSYPVETTHAWPAVLPGTALAV